MNETLRLNSYPSIFAVGHRAIPDILTGDVTVEEKIDGSQFSMGVLNGELHCRSKGQQLVIDAPEKMFQRAIDTAKELAPLLHEGWIYRCEYLSTPKHNTLAYGRTPAKNIIVFDVVTGPETYLTHAEKAAEAMRLGLEVVPLLFQGKITALAELTALLDRESILGGVKIEGFVLKNYAQFTMEKKIAIAKFVSEDFREKHADEWKKTNPTKQDVIDSLIKELRTEARWNKAVQHLREAGQITDSPKDIGPLLVEVQNDILKEEREYIVDKLWNHFWPHIKRGCIAGLPEFYKQKLAEKAFPPTKAKIVKVGTVVDGIARGFVFDGSGAAALEIQDDGTLSNAGYTIEELAEIANQKTE